MAESTQEQVVRIIAELLAEVKKTSGPVDQTGVAFWEARYTLKFTKAVDDYGRVYEGDRRMLLLKAAELAREARSRAGARPITEAEAKLASEKVDCRPPAPGTPQTMDYWCY